MAVARGDDPVPFMRLSARPGPRYMIGAALLRLRSRHFPEVLDCFGRRIAELAPLDA